MPEKGDAVQLHFVEEDENKAFALSSIRKTGQDSPKMANPNEKYIGNPHGKELKMAEQSLSLTAKEGVLWINLDEGDGITIQSDSTIIMNATEDINLDAKKLEFTADEGIYIISGESSMILDGYTDIRGEEVTLDGYIKGPVTVGELVEEERSLPLPPPDPPEEKGFWGGLLDTVQVGLDVVGMIPGVGIAANVVNAGISVGRGDKAGAALSMVSCIPFAGPVVKGAKLGKGLAKGVGKAFSKSSAKNAANLINNPIVARMLAQNSLQNALAMMKSVKGKMLTGSKKITAEVSENLDNAKKAMQAVNEKIQSSMALNIGANFAFDMAVDEAITYISEETGLNASPLLFMMGGGKRKLGHNLNIGGGSSSSGRNNRRDKGSAKEAKNVIAERTKGLDLNEHPTSTKQMSSKKMKELKDKIENRTITKQEYAEYIWNKKFAKRRDKGVKEFWYQEQQRILNNEPPTRDWSQKQLKDILAGKTPKFDGKPIAGHHSYSASKYPHLADKGEIIYPVSFNEHFRGWHGGNWRNSIPGEPIKPIKDF